MNNGPENGAASSAEGQATPRSDGPAAAAPTTSAAPVAAPLTPMYRPPLDRGVPKLARGIVWSDLVREMEEEHAARLARWAAEDAAAAVREPDTRVVRLRPARPVADSPVEGIEEAA